SACRTLPLSSFPPIRTHTLFLFFFLSDSLHHRVLHSFPTRRSSDLVREAPAPELRDGRRRHRPRGAAALDPDAADAGPRHDRERDRKSTRLNSSHSQISYAVFCLKKKKNQA